jgi:hypothetical protein
LIRCLTTALGEQREDRLRSVCIQLLGEQMNLWLAHVAVVFVATLAGCAAQTTRVDDATLPTPSGVATAPGSAPTGGSISGATTAAAARPTRSGASIALMRVGAASPTCRHVQVLLGVRDGAGFRRHKPLQVANVASLADAPVAEVELEAGEYHVVAYACIDGSGKALIIGQRARPPVDGVQIYGQSFASFTLKAGEVVNVGYLHFHASRVGTNAFGRPVRSDVAITDWPLAEIDRFKAQRPALYQRMTTRLMTATPVGPAPPTPDDCQRLKALLADGKVQQLPPQCSSSQTSITRRVKSPPVSASTQ